MPKYSQKWTLVQLLEDLPEGTEYSYKNWPPHITIADIFAVDWEKTNLFKKLSDLLSTYKPIYVPVGDETYLGPPESQVKVTLLEANPELQALHSDVIALLYKSGAVFNNPEYVGEGYLPHTTVQKRISLRKGDSVTIDSATIIDMFPNGDHERRRVLKTIKFSGK
jgi:2'-5' RNA ligase